MFPISYKHHNSPTFYIDAGEIAVIIDNEIYDKWINGINRFLKRGREEGRKSDKQTDRKSGKGRERMRKEERKDKKTDNRLTERTRR